MITNLSNKMKHNRKSANDHIQHDKPVLPLGASTEEQIELEMKSLEQRSGSNLARALCPQLCSVIKQYGLKGRADISEQLLERFLGRHQFSVQEKAQLYSTLLDTYCCVGDMNMALQLYKHMVDPRGLDLAPQRRSLHSLMRLLLEDGGKDKNKSLLNKSPRDLVIEIFERMKSQQQPLTAGMKNYARIKSREQRDV